MDEIVLCYLEMISMLINIFSSFLLLLAVLKLESATHGMIGIFITGKKDEYMNLQISYVRPEYTCT